LYPRRVERICFIQGTSAHGTRAADVSRHYFARPGWIYSDKVSKLACEIIRKTGGRPIKRLEQIFDRIYIDESQDLAGYDLELLEVLMKSKITVTLVGDHRQATFTTNDNLKNRKFARQNVIEKFQEWRASRLCSVEYQYHSYRCIQPICDFADKLHPSLPKTTSRNDTRTGHDGVFALENRHVAAYVAAFNPQVLRYNRKQKDVPGSPMNFGAAKGMTFKRTLIFPHKSLEKYVASGNLADAGKDIAKIYVAVTRARQSVAFVIPNGTIPVSIPVFRF
jgi:DNA helicase-2/ATP-dependent DNA helicase PcrA